MPQYLISLTFWRDSILGGLSKPSKVDSTHMASITATQILAPAHCNHVITQWKGTAEATGNPCASSLPHLTNLHLTTDHSKSLCNWRLRNAKEGSCWCSDFSCHLRWDNCCCKGGGGHHHHVTMLSPHHLALCPLPLLRQSLQAARYPPCHGPPGPLPPRHLWKNAI